MHTFRMVAFASLIPFLGMCSSPGAQEPSVRGPSVPASSGQATVQSCRSFVQGFYEWYPPTPLDNAVEPVLLNRALKSELLSSDLMQQLKGVSEAQTRSGDVLLGFDPILNSQDPSDEYVTGDITRKGEHYLVEVYGISSGRKHEKPDVVPELVFQTGRWTFVNFHYPNRSDSPENENLLSILKAIQRTLKQKRTRATDQQPEGLRQ